MALEVDAEVSVALGMEAVGFSELVHTDWIDSCHTDTGNATVEEWNTAKEAAGIGRQLTNAWEVRQKTWKSSKVR